jgi:hypothetical protein
MLHSGSNLGPRSYAQGGWTRRLGCIRPHRRGEKMLRMRLKLAGTLLGVLLAVGAVQLVAVGMCISLRVGLNGRIDASSAQDLKVIVKIGSATQGDTVTDVRQQSSFRGFRFQVVAWFNTTSTTASEETCDRNPHSVTVELVRGAQVLDRQTLTIEKDFKPTKNGGYEIRKPITLHAEPTTRPST